MCWYGKVCSPSTTTSPQSGTLRGQAYGHARGGGPTPAWHMLSFATAFAMRLSRRHEQLLGGRVGCVGTVAARLYAPVSAPNCCVGRRMPQQHACLLCRRCGIASGWHLSDEVSEEVSGVHFGKIDCTVENSCAKHSVKGYPKVLVMQDGKTGEHRGSAQGRHPCPAEAHAAAIRCGRRRRVSWRPRAQLRCFSARRVAGSATAHASSKRWRAPAARRHRGDRRRQGPAAPRPERDGAPRHPRPCARQGRSARALRPVALQPRPFIARLEPGEQADILHADTLGAMDEAALETWWARTACPFLDARSGQL